ncbi:MAG: WD40 repeat domain-containing protein, partial [Chloroflexota bacterium]
LEGHNGRVLSAAFSSDGAMLASGDASNAVILWDVGTGQIIKRLDEHSGRVNDLAFAPDDSQLVSVSSDTQVFVWNVETGERLRTLGSHGSRVTHVAYNPDGSTFITGDANGLIFVWDARTSFFLREENRHAGAITDIAYSADGSMVLTGSQDGRFILWRDFQNEERRIDDVLSGTAITGIAFVNDDTAMIGTDGAELLVWDLTVEPGQNGVVRRLALPGQLSPVVALDASQSRRFAAVAYENRQVALWEMENGAILQRERVQELPVSDLAATAAGQIVFRYADGLIGIWVPERPLTTTTEAELGLVGARLMPDGETALGQDATSLQPVRYNLSTGEVEQTYDLPILTPDTVFSPDGTLALSPLITETLSLAGSLGDSSAASRVLWDVQTGEEIFTLPGDGFTFSESAALYAISQDNTEIAAVNDLTEILVFDIETGTVVANYPRDRTVTAMVFGPAGGLVVGYTDGGIALRPPENGTWRDLRRHTAPVLSLAISPDKQYIVSGSGDGTVVVWDTSFTEAIRQFVTDTRGISGIVFDASSSTLSTRSVDGNVLLWRFDRDIESVIEWTVDNRFVPVFTRTDCVTFQIPEPCG